MRMSQPRRVNKRKILKVDYTNMPLFQSSVFFPFFNYAGSRRDGHYLLGCHLSLQLLHLSGAIYILLRWCSENKFRGAE